MCNLETVEASAKCFNINYIIECDICFVVVCGNFEFLLFLFFLFLAFY